MTMVSTWGDADFGLTRVHDPADDVRVAETTAAGFSSPNDKGGLQPLRGFFCVRTPMVRP